MESAIAHLRETGDEDKKRELLTMAVVKLYNAVGPDDILRQNEDGTWIFQGRPLTGAEVAQLKEEAAIIRGSRLWLALKRDIQYQLNKKMFEEANVSMDVVWGKLILWLDDCIRTRLKKM